MGYIWTIENFTVEDINKRLKGNMGEALGIEFMEIGSDYLKAKMPVDHRTVQPLGILHGGASAAFAETIGSIAANLAIDRTKYYGVGQQIHTVHLRPALKEDKFVIGICKPVRLGRTTHVWQIWIYTPDDRLISTSLLTVSIRSNDDLSSRKRTYNT